MFVIAGLGNPSSKNIISVSGIESTERFAGLA